MSLNRESRTPVDNYINELFAPEDEWLLKIRSSLKGDGKEGINIGPYEGKILQYLVRAHNIKNVVEVGTLYGYSALWIARALPKDGKLICLEKDKNNFEKAKHWLMQTEVSNKIEIIHGDAIESLERLSARGPFDMVFIDANKAAYVSYLDWAEDNVNKKGLIIGDNTFLFGNVFEDTSLVRVESNEKQIAVMREFNKRLSDPNKFNSILLPTAEGMTLAQKLT